MSKQDSSRTQNCILKVTIDCDDGWLERVKKRIKKIDGLSYASIDANQGKVVVAGNLDPFKVLKKLKCSWTDADLSLTGEQKGENFNKQFQKFQISDNKGENYNKYKKGEGGGQGVAAHSKVVHDLKGPHKERKSVKIYIPEDDDGHDDLEDYSDAEEEEGYGHVHAMPMGNGAGPRGPVGMVSRFLRFVKKAKKGGVLTDGTYKNKNKNKYNGVKEEKQGDRKLEGAGESKSKSDFDFHGKIGKGNNGNGNMGQMGIMDIRAVQGQYLEGMQMQMQPPPYNQQYAAMMMKQQHHQKQQKQQQQQQTYMNNMYPKAIMYERQHPSTNYTPPPPVPVHLMNNPITHVFSDDNVESCTIM